MAVVWQHQLVIRPRPALLERVGDLPERLPWFLRTHVWTAPSAGDHDYEGQHANALTTAKLIFLAAIHRVSRGAEGDTRPDVQQAATSVVRDQSLDEEFFEAHWNLEDAGISLGGPETSVEWTEAILAEQDFRAVVAPERPHLIQSFREEWERRVRRRASVVARRVDFWATAVVRLAHHFGVHEVSIFDPYELVPTAMIGPSLEAAGIAVVEKGELVVEASSHLVIEAAHAFIYRWYGGRRTRRGCPRLLEKGEVLGRRNEAGDRHSSRPAACLGEGRRTRTVAKAP